MNFQVSDKVVCVDDADQGHSEYWNNHIKKGAIYVVRACWISENKRLPICSLVGQPDAFTPSGKLCGWRIERFRKLSDLKAENAAKREAQKTVDQRQQDEAFYRQIGQRVEKQMKP